MNQQHVKTTPRGRLQRTWFGSGPLKWLFALAFSFQPGCFGDSPREFDEPGEGYAGEPVVEGDRPPAGRGDHTPSHDETLLDTECQADVDCRAHGPWRACAGGRCLVQPYGRTLLLRDPQVQEPPQLKDDLSIMLGDQIGLGQLNLLVRLDDPQSWLIQGVRSGSIAGVSTYGQSGDFGAFCGESAIMCTRTACKTSFRLDSNANRLVLYMRKDRHHEPSDACGYQALRLADVSVDVTVDIQGDPGQTEPQFASSLVTIRGNLAESAAGNFFLANGQSLLDILDDGAAVGQKNDRSDGTWPITLSGLGREVFFDNDPTARIDNRPSEPTTGFETLLRACD